ASVQKPFVFPLSNCCNNTALKTLGCLVTGYFPEPVTITWNTNSSNTSTWKFPSITSSSGVSFTASQVAIQGKLAGQRFTCQVKHDPSASHQNRTVKGEQACISSNFTQPTVKLFHSSCDPSGSHTTIQLYCLISNYTPGDFKVTWLKNSQEITNRQSSIAPSKQEGKLASTYAELNITQEEWVSESTFTCKVTYEDSIIEAHAQKCTEYEPRGVSAYLIPPSPLDLYFHKAPKLTCLVVDLENDKVTVTWSRLSKRPVQESSQKVNRYYNATTSITSTLPLVTQDWIEGETYLCTVNYSFLPKPIVRSITKTQGKREIPEIYMFPPPEEKGNQNKLTLTCLIQNFFPKDISVQWLRNKVLIPSNEHSTTVPLNTSGSRTTFFIFSRLEVTRADWMQNNKFTCRVVHEALPEPRTIEKTVSKNPGK
uniref:Immunoglobulin heavy constant epsilon n=1 Tax=Castor canadensis TaxID=51338 RepID=A0A8C0WZ95_CASCN